VWMHMWGEMMPKRGQPEFRPGFPRRTRATRQCGGSHVRHGVVSLRGFGLARMSEHPLHTDEPPDDRGNISVLFKLI
jgi:hypothetical protein